MHTCILSIFPTKYFKIQRHYLEDKVFISIIHSFFICKYYPVKVCILCTSTTLLSKLLNVTFVLKTLIISGNVGR